MRLRNEDGSAAIEFPLAAAVLLIPMAYFALMFAPWSERHSAAELAAAEAARVIATSPSDAANESGARAIAFGIHENFGIDGSEASVFLCTSAGMTDTQKAAATCGTLTRGDTIRVEVRVSMPAVVIPLSDSDGGNLSSAAFSVTSYHDERIDPYRSFAP